MKPKRKINIIGAIDHENYQTFAERMDELEAESHKPITIELCSEGGDTYVGIAFYSRIRSSPCTTTVLIRGQAMSAASIIACGADRRQMQRDSWFMIHDDTYPLKGTDRTVLANECDHHETMEQAWAEILARHSNLAADNWRDMSRVTTYVSAEDCHAFGLIDEVVD